jgi:NosR/NirI family nitrous oxide reductase transcriptional regulator
MGVSLLYLGFLNPNLPSITHVLNPLIQRNLSWDLYLSDPIIFGLFVFLGLAALSYGRVFCGQVCPYGSLVEFANRVSPLTLEVPDTLHRHLLKLKYAVLLALLAAALVGGSLALKLAEVEPFKTTFYVRSRPPIFVAYAIAILLLSTLNSRFFCKYLCPLGALTALMSRFQLFRIKRHDLCGRCRICERECPWGVIDRDGKIDPMECFRCGVCEMNYHDPRKCPALRGDGDEA